MTAHQPQRSEPSCPPRVLHVAHHALPHIGGLETVVAAETQALAARGWDVTLLTSATGTTPGVRVEAGVKVVRIRAWNGMEARFGVPFPVFSPRLLVAMARQVRRADVVHVHDPLYLTSWAAAFWCSVLRTPYVVHRHVGFVHHSSAVVRLVQWVVLGTVARMVLERSAAILPIDEFIAAGVRETVSSPTKVHVLGNAVDTTRFRPPEPGERERLRCELDLPAEGPLVLFVGRFVPKKGFPLVAQAAGDGYRLVFVGGERPAETTDDRLLFLGALDSSKMPDVYRGVDAFVVASVGECPLTVLEAMSSGLPVLLNDDPALHSPWTAGPGVRFVDMAAGELAPAIVALVADRPTMQRIGEEGHRHVRARFSWGTHVERLEAVYRRVLA
ncbi:MAG: glycosyltransferase family 1 protein [Marmoricola sp.]|nr:glycosyltransferase family 1 protein [Marmoricola sp.]